jgi:hypothetical protein
MNPMSWVQIFKFNVDYYYYYFLFLFQKMEKNKNKNLNYCGIHSRSMILPHARPLPYFGNAPHRGALQSIEISGAFWQMKHL